MSVLVRPAALADIRRMAELISGDIPAESLGAWMDSDSAYSGWHVAEVETGEIIGFQRIGPGEALPPEACEIATFLADAHQRMEAGTKLFEATARTARLLSYAWITAEIALGNESGQIYYQSRGFRLWNTGTDKLNMRFDLD